MQSECAKLFFHRAPQHFGVWEILNMMGGVILSTLGVVVNKPTCCIFVPMPQATLVVMATRSSNNIIPGVS